MARPLTDFKALSFDCYGTLIDWETGIWDAFQPLVLANGAPSVDRRALFSAYGELEHALETAEPDLPYPHVLEQVHRGVAERLGLATSEDLDCDFGQSIPHWPAFPDTADALRRLKARYRLIILSNVNRDGIAASCLKLGVEFDAIYVAEDIGAYKPADANFNYLLEHARADLGLEKADILHTAQSLLHDHGPARKFGIANAWIDRQRLSETGEKGVIAIPGAIPATDFHYFTLAEMADAVETG